MFSHKPKKGMNKPVSYVVVFFQSPNSSLSFHLVLYIMLYNCLCLILLPEGGYLFSTKAFHGFLS